MSFVFFSCRDEVCVQSWSYDEVLFNQMESEWKDKDLKNYSFKYSVSDVIPDAITGVVTVINGTGSVELTVNSLNFGDEGYDEELNEYAERNIKIKFTSINEIYSYVKSVVSNRKQEYESKNLIDYVLKITYDSGNSVPSLIDETLFYKDDLTNESENGLWNGELYIKIEDFSLDE